ERAAGLIHQDEVGEGPADVHAEAIGGHARPLRLGPALAATGGPSACFDELLDHEHALAADRHRTAPALATPPRGLEPCATAGRVFDVLIVRHAKPRPVALAWSPRPAPSSDPRPSEARERVRPPRPGSRPASAWSAESSRGTPALLQPGRAAAAGAVRRRWSHPARGSARSGCRPRPASA